MMLIGMHINDEGISVAGLTTENDSPVLIKDSSKKNQHTNSTSLKIYVNEGMAYVGEMVEPLLQAVPKLKVVHRFLSERDEDTDVVQAAKLLAICLKKIHHDIKVFDDSKIENILVSLPDHYTDEQKQQIQLAFELAGLPYTGCIPAAKAIACAYDIKGTANNLIISWYGNNIQLNLINEDQSICFNKNLKIIHNNMKKLQVMV